MSWSCVRVLVQYQGDMDDGCLGEEGMTGIQTRVMMWDEGDMDAGCREVRVCPFPLIYYVREFI